MLIFEPCTWSYKCNPTLLPDNSVWKTLCFLLAMLFSKAVLFERVGLLSVQVWFMAIIDISTKTFRLYDRYKSHIHQIHSGADFPPLGWVLPKTHTQYVCDCVTLKYVWEILWHSHKDLPVLLTACPTLSVVHNGFPHSKLLIYTVSTHAAVAHYKQNKPWKEVLADVAEMIHRKKHVCVESG